MRRLLALFLLLLSPLAQANIYPSESEARSLCESARQTSQTAADNFGHGTTWGCVETTYTTNGPTGLVDYPAVCSKVVSPSPSSCQETFAWEDVPPDCQARNTDPETAPGTGLYLDSAVSAKCVAGCSLDIVGDPLEVVQGRVQGQPANFYRFAREYTGETCDGDTPPDETEFTEQPDEKQCNPSAGVCVTPDGETEYCTFNPDGTPSACVPAVDYDEDGIPDTDDTAPNDDTNGADEGEGDEKDNQAGGGATCAAPPTCSGDGIACATLYQQWRTRCAVEALDGVPGGEPGGEDPTGSYNPATAANQGNDPHPTLESVIERKDGADMVAGLDDSGFGLARTCPALALPTLEIAGYEMDAPWETLCQWLSILAAMILIVGYFHSGWMILKATGG